jgi:hypothetical protein
MNGTKRIPFPGNLFTKCLSDRDGESTARFLEEIGYNQKNWQILAADLRAQHLLIF